MSVPDSEEGLRKAAETGDIEAAFQLGVRLTKQGEADEAERWFRKAAAEGDVEATNNVGLLLMRRGDTAAAEPWLRKAAEAGNVEAARNLRMLHSQTATGFQRWINQSQLFTPRKLLWGGIIVLALGIIALFSGSWAAGVVLALLAVTSLYVTRGGARWVELSSKEKLIAGLAAALGILTLGFFRFVANLLTNRGT